MKKLITSWYTQPNYSSIIVEPTGESEIINFLYAHELEVFDEMLKIDIFVSDDAPDPSAEKLYTHNQTLAIGNVDEMELYFDADSEYSYIRWNEIDKYNGQIVIYVDSLDSLRLKKQLFTFSNFTRLLHFKSNDITISQIDLEIFNSDEYFDSSSKIRYTRFLWVEYLKGKIASQDYDKKVKFYHLVPPHTEIILSYSGEINFINYEHF